MKENRIYLPFLLIAVLLASTLSLAAYSGPETVITSLTLLAQEETIGVNPPGWLGGALAVLSIILPIVTWFWMRREND